MSHSSSSRAALAPVNTSPSGNTRKAATKRWDQGFATAIVDGWVCVRFQHRSTADFWANQATLATKRPMEVFEWTPDWWGYRPEIR